MIFFYEYVPNIDIVCKFILQAFNESWIVYVNGFYRSHTLNQQTIDMV